MEMGEDGGEEGNAKQKKSRSKSDRRAGNTSSKILLSLEVRLSCARYLQSACARCKELGGADASNRISAASVLHLRHLWYLLPPTSVSPDGVSPQNTETARSLFYIDELQLRIHWRR
jgi:hypothetical protein